MFKGELARLRDRVTELEAENSTLRCQIVGHVCQPGLSMMTYPTQTTTLMPGIIHAYDYTAVADPAWTATCTTSTALPTTVTLTSLYGNQAIGGNNGGAVA